MEDSYEKEKRLYFIVDGRVYDPDWAKVTGKIELYGGMNYNVTGPGIPRYKGNRLYVKKI